MKLLKIAGLTAALLASTSAFAAQKDITVVADVDPNMELLQADGSALPQTVRMNYIPGAAANATTPPTTPLGGLQPVTIMTKIFTNDVKKSVLIRLVNSPVLAPTTNTAAKSVPLSVAYNLKDLTTTDTTLLAKDIYPANVAAGAASSNAMPLTIRQTTPGALDASSYSGVVSLVVTQGT